METKAKAKFIRMSPRKVRLVADAVRGLPAEQALGRLKLMKKAAVRPIAKLINSTIANAEHNFELAQNNLFIKEIRIDEAPALKRWMPRAHGRATTIRKRNSHIYLTLAEIKDSGDKKAKQHKIEAPIKLGELSKEKEEAKNIKEELKVKDDNKEDKGEEVVKEIKDPRREGRGGHARAEGGKKGFASKIFRRKSG